MLFDKNGLQVPQNVVSEVEEVFKKILKEVQSRNFFLKRLMKVHCYFVLTWSLSLL